MRQWVWQPHRVAISLHFIQRSLFREILNSESCLLEAQYVRMRASEEVHGTVLEKLTVCQQVKKHFTKYGTRSWAGIAQSV